MHLLSLKRRQTKKAATKATRKKNLSINRDYNTQGGGTMNQCERIMRYLEEFGSITPLEAMEEFGIMRLASRIHDLRAQGVEIEAETEFSKNRYGENVHYTRYKLANK